MVGAKENPRKSEGLAALRMAAGGGAEQEKGAGNEIQLTDSMAKLLALQPFHAYVYEGVTHDCGDKIGLLRANVALALKRPDLGEAARAAISALL